MRPGGVGYRLTCRSAEVITAGGGLAWPCICGRWLPVWLPVWLPGISLAVLTNVRKPGPDAIADRVSNHRPHLEEREAAETYERQVC